MEKFNTHTGLVVPLDVANVDTDQIIPKQFLQKTERIGFGVHLFHDSRYLDHAGTQVNPDFVINKPEYKDATILLARENFGCGSSREHAPWAIEDFGFNTIISTSYADIFYSNCFKNGILPIVLEESAVEALFNACYANDGFTICIDLPEQTVSAGTDLMFGFEVDPFRKHCLINGLDDIGLTLEDADQIRKFEQTWQAKSPWLFADLNT